MRLHRPPASFPSLPSRWFLLAPIVVLASITGRAMTQAAEEPSTCAEEIARTSSNMEGVPAAMRVRVDRALRSASALFRFHRAADVSARVDAVLALLEGPRGERLPDDTRTDLTKSLRAVRSCLAASKPPPLTSVTIHVVAEDGATPAGEGVYVDVEGVRIGRTAPDGTLQAAVPSGTIRIQVIEYPSSWGEQSVVVSPGTSPIVSVLLADSKEPSEDSDLLLEEAPDDILSANATSLTLAFVQDDAPVRIDEIETIELSDERDGIGGNLEEFFSVSDGVVHATDMAAVHRHIAAQSKVGRLLSLSVFATDTEGRSHYGNVRFQLGRFNLAVRLSPPPSNPALPVANIPVRISVSGTDIALRRVADANGRFEIESLPDATIMFDAHTMVAGVHYYANTSLTLCADRSVMLPLLNVKDLVAGARSLIIESGTVACPPLPRQ